MKFQPEQLPPAADGPCILILEPESSAADVLKVGLAKHIGGQVFTARDINEALAILNSYPVTIALLNHSATRDTFSHCFLLKNTSGQLATIVLSAPGKEFKKLEMLQSESGVIDQLLDKPLQFQRLKILVEQLTRQQNISSNQADIAHLRKFLPPSLLTEATSLASSGDSIMTERAILVTDIRRSTRIISQETLDAYFTRLNSHFTRLSDLVSQYRGEVIKYTGDGMLATFDGFGRRQLALKCAIAIMSSESSHSDPFDIGIGINDGLITAGFIGSQSRVFYDVLGSNVNIACRLCEHARQSEILVAESSMKECPIDKELLQTEQIQVRHLDQPVTCYRLNADDLRKLKS